MLYLICAKFSAYPVGIMYFNSKGYVEAEALIVEQRAAPLLGRVVGCLEGSRSQERKKKRKYKGKKEKER